MAPGTVVPPGRLIPTRQLWGGNPCVFIKDLNVAETWSNYTYSYVNHWLSEVHKNEFTMWNSAYLQKESTQEDLTIDLDHPEDQKMSGNNPWRGMIKFYA